MNELNFASIKTLKEKLEKKEISAKELLDYYINRFNKYDQKINSALEIFDKDSILENSKGNGPLFGIPGLVKDNICQKNRIASCGSKILQNYRAPYDSTASERLKNSGALLMGRANMDEFAMGSSGEYSAYKKATNPWNTECVPGGSSSGSIASVAAGLVPWALGSETGGSVRQPAALSGVVGLKPTYGLVSRYGLVAYASSLDQIGVATRTVYDNALILSAIAGQDPKDSTTKKVNQKDYTLNLSNKLKDGLTIGIIDNAMQAKGVHEEVSNALNEAIKLYEKLGVKIKHITLPTMDYGAAVYFIISRAEAASNLARFDGVRYGYRSKKSETLDQMYSNSRDEGFGLEVKSRILIGNYVLSAGHADQYYKSAKIVQALMAQEFADAFKDVDLLFSPVSPSTAFKFGAFADNALELDLQDYFTCPVNLAGIPAISIPCGFSKDKMPIGFQLIGPELSEELLFQVGHVYEQNTEWHKMHPENLD